MELRKLSNRIWYSMYEKERDRPCLGYVRGDNWSLAVDAGHSDTHVEEFYAALEQTGLSLPALIVLTHWHWDHAFGMHRVHGLCAANARTNAHLREFAAKISAEGEDEFLNLDSSIQKEYAGGKPVVIVPADIEFSETMMLDLGGVSVHLSTCTSPHTDDTTLIYVPEEKFLFLGDCISGVFPTWERDPQRKQELIRTLEAVDAAYCLGGHWPVFKKEDLLQALREEAI